MREKITKVRERDKGSEGKDKGEMRGTMRKVRERWGQRGKIKEGRGKLGEVREKIRKVRGIERARGQVKEVRGNR